MAEKYKAICFREFTPGNEYRAFGASDEAEPLKKVKAVADYLFSENIKFRIHVIPEYINQEHPEQNISLWDNSSVYIQEFINTLNYLKSKGGMELDESIINMTEFQRNYWLEPDIAVFNCHFYREFDYMILDDMNSWKYDSEKISPLHQLIQDGMTDNTEDFFSRLLVQGYKSKPVKKMGHLCQQRV
ncbi:DUF2334 domain-containing protein [Aminipila terrae]|uniref:DUF2334 domain-containing protein n=1 Tax=Aminipila terrae TaxID=2697030 RepID=A0A6P1MER6_9FIRM|nr:DUF2334 domain-containing protein [Aminipila terrae]QHI72311.1 DUF2334 domain-containing protein [Aminipila terrae]